MATHTISWLQHQLPNPPKYLLYYKDGSNQRRKEGVSDRFVASKDASLNACHLTISEVQAADEATYYCLSSTGSEYHCATHYGVMKTKPYALGNSFTTASKRRPAGWWIQLQAQVTQSGPVSVAIAGRTIINCTLQGVQFISTTNPSWYHQEEGQPPKLLFYRSRERAPGIPDRLSADTSGNNAQLTISNVEGGDEGDYYCAVWHNNKLHTVAFRCRTETQSPAQRN
ncbi:hypothetical protein E2320_012610, partial [Naja naja]